METLALIREALAEMLHEIETPNIESINLHLKKPCRVKAQIANVYVTLK